MKCFAVFLVSNLASVGNLVTGFELRTREEKMSHMRIKRSSPVDSLSQLWLSMSRQATATGSGAPPDTQTAGKATTLHERSGNTLQW